MKLKKTKQGDRSSEWQAGFTGLAVLSRRECSRGKNDRLNDPRTPPFPREGPRPDYRMRESYSLRNLQVNSFFGRMLSEPRPDAFRPARWPGVSLPQLPYERIPTQVSALRWGSHPLAACQLLLLEEAVAAPALRLGKRTGLSVGVHGVRRRASLSGPAAGRGRGVPEGAQRCRRAGGTAGPPQVVIAVGY